MKHEKTCITLTLTIFFVENTRVLDLKMDFIIFTFFVEGYLLISVDLRSRVL